MTRRDRLRTLALLVLLTGASLGSRVAAQGVRIERAASSQDARALVPELDADASPPGVSPSALPEEPAPVPAEGDVYMPLQRVQLGGVHITLPLTLGARLDLASPVRVDATGGRWDPERPALTSHLRLGLRADSQRTFERVRLELRYEHQVISGTYRGGVTGDPLSGAAEPLARGTEHQLREASLRARLGERARVLAGVTTSHWGMGVVANDGAQYYRPGSATFGDPEDGDVVARLAVVSGPFGPLAFVAGVSADWVYADDILLQGDDAYQLVAFAALAPGQPTSAGAYMVLRRQRSADGRELNVQVVDLTGSHRLALGAGVSLELRGEAALVLGETTLTGTASAPRHRVIQGGLALSASARAARGGGVLDVYFASGDGNPDDARQTGFRFDPEFRAGLLLFETVLAAQTARGAVRGGDPLLVGQPAGGIERLPTRGSVTNALALYPRGYLQVTPGLELYGGVLFAWAAAPPVDPYNTRIAGGVAQSALGGEPGRYYGTEVNVGARALWALDPARALGGTELTLGLEGALLVPGDAIVDARGADTGKLFALHASGLYRF